MMSEISGEGWAPHLGNQEAWYNYVENTFFFLCDFGSDQSDSGHKALAPSASIKMDFLKE